MSCVTWAFRCPRGHQHFSPAGDKFRGSRGHCQMWWFTRQTHRFHSELLCACKSESHSVLSNSLRPHGIYSPGKSPWVAFPFSRGSSQPRDQTQVFHIAGGFFTSWATRQAQEYWSGYPIPSQTDLSDQELNQGLVHCRWILYQLSSQGKWNFAQGHICYREKIPVTTNQRKRPREGGTWTLSFQISCPWSQGWHFSSLVNDVW